MTLRFANIRKIYRRLRASFLIYRYRASHWVRRLVSRHGRFLFLATTTILFLSTVYLSPIIQNSLETHFATDQRIEGLRNLILNIGSALIGATAIVTSLVLFAMQVNIERMPYGLFYRLSKDIKLLLSFALPFILAIHITILSIFIDKQLLSNILLLSSWSIIFILSSYLYAYRRALTIINPLQQLSILLCDTLKELQAWARSAHHAAYIMELQERKKTNEPPTKSTHDLSRVIYFSKNEKWADGATMSVRHAMSFVRRYAAQGDHEVSGAALKTVININAVYITAKGKTFFASNPFVDNPLAHDGFINNTLEYLRKNVQDGITRRDEQQIEQTFQALTELVHLYISIDYSNPHATKSHAILASCYLADAIQSATPLDLTDVLMKGLRLMGKSAQYILASGKPTDICQLIEKITQITSIWSVKDNYLPVAMEGMTQLATLTIKLLYCKSSDIRFVAKKIRTHATLIAKLFLNIQRTSSLTILSDILGPYYSSTSTQSLRSIITKLANNLSEAKGTDTNAQSIIRNIERWADGLYQTEKELLLTAINANSHFAFDMIYWITGISEILMAVSNAPACNDNIQEKLRKHASWLMSTLTWIPDDKEKLTFIENIKLTDILFEAAVNARNHDCDDIAKQIGKILLSWTFKAGKYQNGWNVLEQGLCALAAFALTGGDEGVSWVKMIISTLLAGNSAPEKEIRNYAAKQLLERVANLYNNEYLACEIEIAIAKADHGKLVPLLQEIAYLLSPEIASEKCREHQPPI